MFLRHGVSASRVYRRQSQPKLSQVPRQTQTILKLGTCRPAVGQSAEFIPRGLRSTQAALQGCPDSCGLSRAVLAPGEGGIGPHKLSWGFHRKALTHSHSVYHLQGF